MKLDPSADKGSGAFQFAKEREQLGMGCLGLRRIEPLLQLKPALFRGKLRETAFVSRTLE